MELATPRNILKGIEIMYLIRRKGCRWSELFERLGYKGTNYGSMLLWRRIRRLRDKGLLSNKDGVWFVTDRGKAWLVAYFALRNMLNELSKKGLNVHDVLEILKGIHMETLRA